MLKLGSIYPRGYIEPRSNIPGVHWMGGMLDLLQRHVVHSTCRF